MDFYTDQGAFMVKLLHSTSVPDFVKTSQYDTEESVNSLPDVAFASPEDRHFPIHTPANVYLSAAYLHGKSATLNPEIDAAIQKAAVLFGIEEDVTAVVKLAQSYRESRTKVASPSSNWEFETKTASFAGSGLEHLKTAATRFELGLLSYDVKERTEIAQNLLKVANDLGVELPSIDKYAGVAHIDPVRLEGELQARALALHDSRDTEAFLGKIAELQDAAEITQEEGFKTAAFLDTFDRQAGLTRFYGSRLSDPHAAVFNTPRAEHEAKTATLQIGEVTHKAADLKNVSMDVFTNVLGDTFKLADLSELSQLDPEKARLVNQVLA